MIRSVVEHLAAVAVAIVAEVGLRPNPRHVA